MTWEIRRIVFLVSTIEYGSPFLMTAKTNYILLIGSLETIRNVRIGLTAFNYRIGSLERKGEIVLTTGGSSLTHS